MANEFELNCPIEGCDGKLKRAGKIINDLITDITHLECDKCHYSFGFDNIDTTIVDD